MQYNYSLEIAAAIIMCLLFAVNTINQNLDLSKSRFYFAFLLSCLIETIMNVASSIGLERTDIVSNDANYALCIFFFLAEASASMYYFMYVLSICETKKKLRIIFSHIAVIPFFFFIALIGTNGIYHTVFSMNDNVYSQGSLAWYGYLYIEAYLIGSMIVAIKGRKTIRGRNRYSVVLAVLISLVAIVIQSQVKEVLLTGFANAVVLLIFYIVVQSPNELRDKIANVFNDRAFCLRFENAMNQDKKITILTIDIHGKSQLNALLGYREGNVILGEVGSYLAELVGQDNAFYISQNVFAIIIFDENKVYDYRDKIRERFRNKWMLDNIEILVPVNICRIDCPTDAKLSSEVYGLHDYMMMLLSQDPMSDYLEATTELKEKYKRNADVSGALKKALEKKSLEVYFQPIYDNNKKHFTTLEALARLTDENLGFIPPDEFIDVAENNGTIVLLDLLVLEKVCQFLAEKVIPINDRLKIEAVNVNISVVQCMQQNMDSIILSIIDSYNIPRDMIVLEITERATVSAAELMTKHMNSLLDKGIKFALDDYGTGNSNCSYLINYPFSKVKFDKSMVWSYFESDTGEIILDGEMKTIHKLKIPIVAEGIETKEQYDVMTENGVELIQGYYFSKPLPPDALINYLEEKVS